MPQADLIFGEYRRLLDERFRLSLPSELIRSWGEGRTEAVLAKEKPGCVSLWQTESWEGGMESGLDVVRSRMEAGRLRDQMSLLQTFGRLMSTRHRRVHIAGRGRLALPEGFREFLGAEPGSELIVVGAAVCIEIWQTEAWRDCLKQEISQFSEILEQLSR